MCILFFDFIWLIYRSYICIAEFVNFLSSLTHHLNNSWMEHISVQKHTFVKRNHVSCSLKLVLIDLHQKHECYINKREHILYITTHTLTQEVCLLKVIGTSSRKAHMSSPSYEILHLQDSKAPKIAMFVNGHFHYFSRSHKKKNSEEINFFFN